MIAAIGGSAYTVAAAPLLPWWAIAALAGAALLVLALGLAAFAIAGETSNR